MSKAVIALLIADVHLSERPPVARLAEPDWFEAMARPFDQLERLREKYHAPVICCGDLFNQWNPSPRLINFALQNIPEMYSIAGQHDLRHHDYDSIEDTAYWTLVEAGKIFHLQKFDHPFHHNANVGVLGYSWGEELKPIEKRSDVLQVAVIHRYCWTRDHSYPNAPEDQQVSAYRNKLKGFNLAIFGDNHSHFYHETATKPSVYNCGCLIRRSINERKNEPAVGLLMSDGTVQWELLDCSADKWLDEDNPAINVIEKALNMRGLIDELESLDHDSLSFLEQVERFCKANDVSRRTRKVILEAIEGDK
jgi:DNA repair exonuclease SbcCD nuclease subunit